MIVAQHDDNATIIPEITMLAMDIHEDGTPVLRVMDSGTLRVVQITLDPENARRMLVLLAAAIEIMAPSEEEDDE